MTTEIIYILAALGGIFIVTYLFRVVPLFFKARKLMNILLAQGIEYDVAHSVVRNIPATIYRYHSAEEIASSIRFVDQEEYEEYINTDNAIKEDNTDEN